MTTSPTSECNDSWLEDYLSESLSSQEESLFVAHLDGLPALPAATVFGRG